MTRHSCMKCGAALGGDEIALHKKLIFRAATEYFCIDCLAAYLEVTPEDIEDKIQMFKEDGCELFK